MKKYSSILLGICYLLIAGCSKDKGNYDLVPINQISIDDQVTGTIPVFQYDNLKLTPRLEQTMAVDEDKLVYSWLAYAEANPKTSYPISNTKNLDVKIELLPGNYIILYTVKDTQTGVLFFKEYKIAVSTRLSEGWMILEDISNGKQEISMINASDEVFHNLYQTANNGQSLPDNAHTIRVVNSGRGNAQRIFVLADNNAIEINYAGFKKIDEMKDWFFSMPSVVNVQNYSYGKLGAVAFVVNDSELYSLSLMSGEDPIYKFGAPIKGDWKISPYIFPFTFGDYALLYDVKNQRFLAHSYASISSLSNPPGSAFDPGNVGKEMVFGGAGSSFGSYYNCLMKNNNENKFFVYTVDASAFTDVIAVEQYEVEDAAELQNASLFAFSGMFPHMYYAVNNKIYLLDIPAQKSRLAYSFPAGTEITAIKLKQSTSLVVDYPDDNKQFVAATYQGGEGKIYKFDISNTGDFEGDTYAKEYTGFKKIKYLEYKNKK
ncbi:hypothetical protein HMPREF0765_4581 [Sphingobacterium spiritivorum ATCC 33300]|uniref:Bacteroidetes PKD-like domain-containing protein n=1 Tax=Sphingobacterium spiritivorum ATCC 33300 TaxID=525372 RepID=C2G4S5_SPHSI|nr:PKD-like family lipoprotein [Sphingobacterium spiritivorum]EEI89888.1 hypothetical protein HMPREF0765_4581 [Sphingobacterium spiritivorum ATCC 33300]QQS94787.1 hypothetical protein I6J03_15545 [Sphingobacterium spiritivorum]